MIMTYLAAATALGLALGAGATFAQQAAPASQSLPPQYRGHGHPGERHPALHRAIRDLERARAALQRAPEEDKADGNAQKAIKSIDVAIAAINKTLYPPR
jgi:hypothetical protein